MKNLFLLSAHILVTIVKLLRPGGAQALISENLLLKKQLLIVNRSRKRAPNLSPLDRLFLGLLAMILGPRRALRSAIIIRPSTLFRYLEVLKSGSIGCCAPPKKKESPVPRGHLPNSFSSF